MNAAVIYEKLAPFHVARLEQAGRLWKARGSTLACIEIAGEQSSYRWPSIPRSSGEFTLLTLFPKRESGELAAGEVRQAIKQALEDLDADVIVINGWASSASRAALAWCCGRGTPRVVISDSQYIDRPRRFWKESLKRFFVKQCHAGFAGGSPHVRYLQSLGLPAGSCVVGCDVIDNSFFGAALRRKLENGAGNTPEVMNLLSCLRLLEIKNIPFVLRTLKRLTIPWKWTIAGDGPERERISRLLDAPSLRERVVMIGRVDYDGIPPVYEAGGVYLQPSVSEPWGLAVNEAMASGLPVLVSKRCGCREDLITEGLNGYVFDPTNSDDLARVLNLMWARRSDWREMGLQSSMLIRFWSLDLFSRSLWRACEIAIQRAAESEGRRTGLDLLWRLV